MKEIFSFHKRVFSSPYKVTESNSKRSASPKLNDVPSRDILSINKKFYEIGYRPERHEEIESYYQFRKIQRGIKKYRTKCLVIFGRRANSNFRTEGRVIDCISIQPIKTRKQSYSNGTKTEINHASWTERVGTTLRVGKNGRNGRQSETQNASLRRDRCWSSQCEFGGTWRRGSHAKNRSPGRSIESPSKRTDLPRDPARLSAPVAASPVSRLIKRDSPIRFMTERCLPRDIDDKGHVAFYLCFIGINISQSAS